MTQEQKNIKICEVRGWKMITTKDCGQYPHGIDPNGDRMHTALLPDYFSDLNACHEMEKVLTDEQYIKWAMLVNQAWLDANHGHTIMRSASATAAQRAEAFGMTLNLW